MNKKTDKFKVFFNGSDGWDWALDEDLRLLKIAATGSIDSVGIENADIVHSIHFRSLKSVPISQLAGKHIIYQFTGEPFNILQEPDFQEIVPLVSKWVTRSRQAQKELQDVGIQNSIVPYIIDPSTFRNLNLSEDHVARFRTKWNIPKSSYIISSFQRDSEGKNLLTPKLVKGPDIFLEIIKGLNNLSLDFHILLAGPRRHWLINQLEHLQIKYTYIGNYSDQDDLKTNKLSRKDINELYNLSQLTIISSRSEGGPHAVLEASSAKCKIISTAVGHSEEILHQNCIFTAPDNAVDIISNDIKLDKLAKTLEYNYNKSKEYHPANVRDQILNMYSESKSTKPVYPKWRSQPIPKTKSGLHLRVLQKLGVYNKNKISVGLWHKFVKPPYGGGNQFMLVLHKMLRQKGVRVINNQYSNSINNYILNSVFFDINEFKTFHSKNKPNMIHRIDGPISLIRGSNRELDDLCFELNEEFASATILQSAWTYKALIQLGYNPKNPVIIYNAVDNTIFNRKGKKEFDSTRKIRLISTSWSPNERKGGKTYKWIEENLDWDRFEYTFIGNTKETFSKIQHIPPLPSKELSQHLKSHDIYITASQNDPCSNALIEALECGLPSLYLNDGGHPELVGSGGLPFDSNEEILPQLERITNNYQIFQNLITTPNINEIAHKYLTVIKETNSFGELN